MERDARADLAICEAATDGPWEVCIGSGINMCTAIHSYKAPGKLICDFLPEYFLKEGYATEDHRADMNFVAIAREALPYWISAFLDLKLEYDHMRHERDGWKAQAQESEASCAAMRDALRWCGGSPSFAPEGEARKGWVKLVEPLLDGDGKREEG